jgi:hypothetical protein
VDLIYIKILKAALIIGKNFRNFTHGLQYILKF